LPQTAIDGDELARVEYSLDVDRVQELGLAVDDFDEVSAPSISGLEAAKQRWLRAGPPVGFRLIEGQEDEPRQMLWGSRPGPLK